MNLLLIPHVVIVFLWQGLYAYTRGAWFMITSPLQFIAFVDEWKKFAPRIEANEDKQLSGYNRATRRRAGF